MTRHKVCLRTVACLLLGFTFGANALASVAATVPDPLNLDIQTPANAVVGWEFSPLFDIEVTALGIFDFDGDGMSDVHTLAIWTSAGDLITQQLFVPGTGTTLIDQFRYQEIVPIMLQGDEKYIIGAYYPGTAGDAIAVANFANEFETSAFITALGGRVASTDGFTFPDVESSAHFFGPNFQFTVVPVPAAAYLFLTGLITLLGVARRR